MRGDIDGKRIEQLFNRCRVKRDEIVIEREKNSCLGVGRYSETRFDTYHDTLDTIRYISRYILYPKCLLNHSQII